MSPRVTFPNKILPYLLIAPQLVIVGIFFYWPASQALYQSVLREDPFGLRSTFVGLANFRRVLAEPNYINALQNTAVFSIAVAFVAMSIALLLAIHAWTQRPGTPCADATDFLRVANEIRDSNELVELRRRKGKL